MWLPPKFLDFPFCIFNNYCILVVELDQMVEDS